MRCYTSNPGAHAARDAVLRSGCEQTRSAWLSRFRQLAPPARLRTRSGLWRTLLRYHEQNTPAVVSDVTHVNYSRRARLSARFHDVPPSHLSKLTATVQWAPHLIHTDLASLASELYAAQGYRVASLDCPPRVTPRAQAGTPPLFLTRNNPLLRAPLMATFSPTPGENMSELCATTPMSDILNAIPLPQRADLLSQTHARLCPPQPDTHLPMQQRQQMAATTSTLTNWHVHSGHSYIHFGQTPVHPTKDIDVPRSASPACFVRLVRPDEVDLHDAGGRFVATIATSVYSSLWISYSLTTTLCGPAPSPATPETFLSLLIRSMRTRRQTYMHAQTPFQRLSRHAIVGAVVHTFQLSQHRLTSPAGRHPDIPIYFSQSRDDHALGAVFDSFSTLFLGPSLVTPGEELEDIYKAMKWSILSCYQDAPAFTVILIPVHAPTVGYHTWFSHPIRHVSLRYCSDLGMPTFGGFCQDMS